MKKFTTFDIIKYADDEQDKHSFETNPNKLFQLPEMIKLPPDSSLGYSYSFAIFSWTILKNEKKKIIIPILSSSECEIGYTIFYESVQDAKENIQDKENTHSRCMELNMEQTLNERLQLVYI